MTSTTSTAASDAIQRIAGLATDFSQETTLPSAANIDALRDIMPPGTPVFVTSVPTKPLDSCVVPSAHLRSVGLEPVPHIAARNFADLAQVDELLGRLADQAQVRRALILTGDLDTPRGDVFDALAIIRSGLLQKRGIKLIGISGYPEGHPRIPHEVLLRTLPEKIKAARDAGLDVEIVTQFGFDAAPIANWITRLRDDGHHERVRVGLAGLASFTSLLKYAARCGVKASARGAARNTSLFKQMFGGLSAPDDLIRALALDGPPGHLGDIKLHYFSFGGIPTTASWATSVARGQIVLDSEDGFSVRD